jgi:hypothetical protein
MKATPELIALVERVPDLDGQGKVHGITWEESTPIIEGIFALGRDGIAQLVSLLKAVDDGADYKPRYLLHTLVVFAGRAEQAARRTVLADALASLIGSAEVPRPVQGYLIRQLQLVSSAANIPAIASQLNDAEIGDHAAQAILAIGGDAAASTFREALTKAPDDARKLPLIQAIGVLRDKSAAPALRPLLASANLRLTTAKALARCGDRDSADALLELARTAEGWERMRLTDACLDLADLHPDLAAKLQTARTPAVK